MGEYIIEAKGIGCKSGYKYLLHQINWKVRAGEHWLVFGMNGSGKTTLLSIIAGFQRFTEGSLQTCGEEWTAANILRQRQRIGWVSSSFFDKYYTRESVLDIVLSGKFGTLGLNGLITVADRKQAIALLTELQLGERLYYTFDLLSKGERQNVLIARALISRPEILVLDEPCTGLDIYHREYLFQTLELLAAKRQLTIIYVTHYVEEIRPMFDRCLLLKNGRVFTQGETATLFQAETLGALLGYPVEIEKNDAQMMQLKVLNVQTALQDL